MMLQDIWLPLGVVLAVASVFVLRFYDRKLSPSRRLQLPPTPSGRWPIVGHLPLLGTLPHRSLLELAKKYGPIMYMHLGLIPVVVVSSAAMLKEALHDNDVIMASRPSLAAFQILGFDGQDIAAQPYGERWRDMRKLFMRELLSSKRLNELQAVRRGEVLHAVGSISFRAKKSVNSSVDLRRELRDMTFNNTTQMVASKRYYGPKIESEVQTEEFAHLMNEVVELVGVFEVGDYIPFLKRFDLQGNIKRMHDTAAGFSRLMDNIFLEHTMGTGHRASGVKDFADTLLELQKREDLQDSTIKGLIFDFLVAGTETTATALEWLMADLQVNPKAMREIQKELDEVVGRNRIVEESDLPNLQYLQSCIKESMRLHPPLPIMVPHESTASCTIGGYYIPAQVMLYVNLASIHWNPETYDEPQKFKPERFLNSRVDIRGQDFDLTPFGTGRRICMGMNMAILMVQFGSAVLLQSYDWKLTEGTTPETLDMSERTGSVCSMKFHLNLVPTPRLPAHVYAAENIEM